MLTLITLQKKFLHSNVIFPPLVYHNCWKKVSTQTPHCFCFLTVEYLHKLFGIALWEVCLFSFYLLVYTHGLMNIYFLLWVIIQHYFVAQSCWLWAPAVGPSVPLAYRYRRFLFVFEHFLFSGTTNIQSSFCVFSAPLGSLFITIFLSPFETIFCVVV